MQNRHQEVLWGKSLDLAALEALMTSVCVKAVSGQSSGWKLYKGLKEKESCGKRVSP